jgi:putative N-acetylmannosamine-6-phosphate epimerase
MCATTTIVALARSAQLGGADALRIDGADNIAAAAEAVTIPIIGINKALVNDTTLITPDLDVLAALVDAGASLLAFELTTRAYPDPGAYRRALATISHRSGLLSVPLIADISTVSEATDAANSGCDLVATTLSGYTRPSQSRTLPDLGLVEELAAKGLKVVAEGGYSRPDQALEAIKRGAWAVCVGTAITDPISITRDFAAAMHCSTAPPMHTTSP